MRCSLLVFALFLLVAGVAAAREDLPPEGRVAQLEHELHVAHLELRFRKAMNAQLHELIDDLFARLNEHHAADSVGADAREQRLRAVAAANEDLRVALQAERERRVQEVTQLRHALMLANHELEEQRMAAAQEQAHVLALRDEVQQLRSRLDTERGRHAADVARLQEEVARTHAKLQAQETVIQCARDKANAETARAIELSKEMDRLRWDFAKGAPKDTVAARMADVPAAHWRGELTSDDALRARVALSVLAVLPDPSPEGAALVLRVASRHRELLDRATLPLLRVGEPAVDGLVAAARSGAVPAAWAVHVLGEMGEDAKAALPWLAELAEGEGRDAAAARRAIQRIEGAPEDPR